MRGAPRIPCIHTSPGFVRGAVTRPQVVAVTHRLRRVLVAMLRDATDFDAARRGGRTGRFQTHHQLRRYRVVVKIRRYGAVGLDSKVAPRSRLYFSPGSSEPWLLGPSR